MAEVERSGSESEWHGFSSPGSVCGDLFAGGDVNSGSLLVSSFQSDALESTNSSLLGLTVPVRRDLVEGAIEPRQFNWSQSKLCQEHIHSSLYMLGELENKRTTETHSEETDSCLGPVHLHALAGSADVNLCDVQSYYYYETAENPMSLAESLKNVIQNTVKLPRSFLSSSRSRSSSPVPLKLVTNQELLAVSSGIENGSLISDSYNEIASQYHQSFYKFHGRHPEMEKKPSLSPTSSDWSDSLGPPEPTEFNETAAASGLNSMLLEELRSMYEEMSSKASKLSDLLIALLTSRDQLQLEIEIRNDFIAAVLQLQELMQSRNVRSQQPSKSKLSFKKVAGNQGLPRYLDTVIPYIPCPLGQDIKTVQLLTKVVEAICANSSELPKVLQEYMICAELDS